METLNLRTVIQPAAVIRSTVSVTGPVLVTALSGQQGPSGPPGPSPPDVNDLMDMTLFFDNALI